MSGWMGIGHVLICTRGKLHVECDGIGTRLDLNENKIACRIGWQLGMS